MEAPYGQKEEKLKIDCSCARVTLVIKKTYLLFISYNQHLSWITGFEFNRTIVIDESWISGWIFYRISEKKREQAKNRQKDKKNENKAIPMRYKKFYNTSRKRLENIHLKQLMRLRQNPFFWTSNKNEIVAK